jgi:hypothetical protein
MRFACKAFQVVCNTGFLYMKEVKNYESFFDMTLVARAIISTSVS